MPAKWKSIDDAGELREYLLAHPTISDGLWTTAKRNKGEDRSMFITRVLFGDPAHGMPVADDAEFHPSEVREYSVPGLFWEDHTARGLPETGYAQEVKVKGRSVVVKMDDEAFLDLYTDALYYLGASKEMQENGVSKSLLGSAESTVRSLRRQDPSTLTADADDIAGA